ncbi:MAG: metalloregulator ArsR/SmtB family transcription factor [Fulvivirga sp.]|uniref:ArsR/SmtB family transcription factor n=1 Tax=Fulvivirga sp. TaxID=1931237 RepID=UPI0032EAFA79
MGHSKSEQFSAQHNQMAVLAKALGHPARIAIIEHLIKSPSCICGDIVEELPLSQSTVSQHLKELKNAGIIKGTIEGPSVCYCINDEMWDKVKSQFASFFETYVPSNDCC